MKRLLNPDGARNTALGFSGTLDPTGWRTNCANAAETVQSAVDTWSPLGIGLWDYVRAIAVEGQNVYVGGDFTNAGGNLNADHIAY